MHAFSYILVYSPCQYVRFTEKKLIVYGRPIASISAWSLRPRSKEPLRVQLDAR